MKSWLAIFPFVTWLALASPPARAEIITKLAFPYSGDPTEVRVVFRDGTDVALDGTVEVELTVTGTTADLRGVFLNVADEALLDGLAVAGANVTSFLKGADAVSNLGAGVNSNPEGPFDFGVELGTAGIGTDDLATATFVLSYLGRQLSVADFLAADPVSPSGPLALTLAVRVTSVLVDGERSGSSKLGVEWTDDAGEITTLTTPEPTGLGLVVVGGALAFGWGRRRR